MSQTIGDFIIEKKTNFTKFMQQSFGADENEIIKEQIEMLEKMPVSDFMAYINHYIKPHKSDNFDSFISGLCVTYNVDKPEVISKCRRYLELFCSVSSS